MSFVAAPAGAATVPSSKFCKFLWHKNMSTKNSFAKKILKNAKDRDGSVKYSTKKDFLEIIKKLPKK